MDDKILKEGTLVYHKENGQGIITRVIGNNLINNNNKDIVYTIMFENADWVVLTLGRKLLFVVGDKVRIIHDSWQQPFYKDDIRIYKGYAPYTTKNHFVVSIPPEKTYGVNGFTHVYDIEHVEEKPQINIT